MSVIRFVASDGLEALLDGISQLGMRVLAPAERPATSKPSVVFAPWRKGDPVVLAKATVPPKEAVLPECETIVTYGKTRDPQDLNLFTLECAAGIEADSTLVFACRPCDARGFDCLDKPYLHGLFEDPYYKARREKLVVISLTCDTGCETCFCHWVGGGPSSPIGSDILMTRIEGGFLLQAISARGGELLTKTATTDGADKMADAITARKRAWESLVPAPDLSGAADSLEAIFSNEEFWTRWTDRCISCGACTYFCPTCYCFNITDEDACQRANGGRRLRSWDNCMSSRYTREASGHNPRPHKFQRMRNRVSHKFWTFSRNWASFLCSGCGRCITNCPVHLDIRAIVLAAIKAGANAANPTD